MVLPYMYLWIIVTAFFGDFQNNGFSRRKRSRKKEKSPATCETQETPVFEFYRDRFDNTPAFNRSSLMREIVSSLHS